MAPCLDDENAALLALLESAKQGAWSDLANECLVEGSALQVLGRRIGSAADVRSMSGMEQGVLFDMEYAGESVKLTQSWRRASRQLERWHAEGLDFVSIFDDRFPSQLRSVVDVPPFLFVKGTLLSDDMGVSVVGSRKCSPDGAAFARGVAGLLCERGLTVIAGLAEGIDACAHREALRAGGRTVAFIGTGINRCYPPSNRRLQQAIEERGVVLSPFWPDSPPSKRSFPLRNALISGYGLATVIVEASEYSGTRVLARRAQWQGHPLIFRDRVLEQTEWAREYQGKPGAFVVRSVDDVGLALDAISAIDSDVDGMLGNMIEMRTRNL